MGSADDDRSRERFVAGIGVRTEALAQSIATEAVDRTIVTTALLSALASPRAAARLSTARRIARLSSLPQSVAARLVLAMHTDEHDGVRAACVDALRAHRLPGGDGLREG